MLATLQCINTISVISKWGKFSPFSYLVILLLVLPSNYMVSGVENSRKYAAFILNIILFFILFTYVIIEELSVTASCFFKNIQNNLEYLIHRIWSIRWLKFSIPCQRWYFKFIIFVWLFCIFLCLVNAKVW